MDSIDAKILTALQQDGRKSTVELAADIGLSPTPCARRVRKLEQAGVIRRYVAVLDPKKVGLAVQAVVQVNLERHTEGMAESFREAVLTRPEVVGCSAMTGEMDFLLQIVVPDIDALNAFVMHGLLRIAGVRDVRTSLVLETIKATSSLPLTHIGDAVAEPAES